MYRWKAKNRTRISNRIAFAAAGILALTLFFSVPGGDMTGESAANPLATLASNATGDTDDSLDGTRKRGFNIRLLLFRGG